MIFIWIAMNDSCQGWCVKTLGGAVTPCRCCFNALSHTPTWLNSINPQRSLDIFYYFFFAVTLAPLLRLVLQSHSCVTLAYKRRWTLPGSRPGDFDLSASLGGGRRPPPARHQLLLVDGGCGRSCVITELGEASSAGPRPHPPTHPPYPVLMTNQNEKWRRGRAWFVLHAKYGL